MIIEFSVANFWSIKDLQTISFLASPKNQDVTFIKDIPLLKTIAIYGANASGKSNLIKALGVFFSFVQRTIDNERIGSNIIPFVLNTQTEEQPTFFQIIFITSKGVFRYGFEYQDSVIISEWLFKVNKSSENKLFTRESSNKGTHIEIDAKRFKEGWEIQRFVKQSNLFLNICNEFNGELSTLLKVSLNKYSTLAISYLGTVDIKPQTKRLAYNDLYKPFVLDLLQSADIDIIDYQITNDVVFVVKRRFKEKEPQAIHQLFDLERVESSGTKKLFYYAFRIFDALENGKILIIDEFDSQLHSLLTKKIIELFNSNLNQKSQLIFVTHDTDLQELLDKEQIYLAEKNNQGETSCYSLADIDGIRDDHKYYKNDYLKGKFGGIPFLKKFDNFIDKYYGKEERNKTLG